METIRFRSASALFLDVFSEFSIHLANEWHYRSLLPSLGLVTGQLRRKREEKKRRNRLRPGYNEMPSSSRTGDLYGDVPTMSLTTVS